VPLTALQHFQENIARASAIIAHADTMPITLAAVSDAQGQQERYA
jgi:hypothetical protein